jgi:hypothetical protein
MPDSSPHAPMSIGRLILIPSVITLGITLLRLVGELKHWSPILFNPAAGGGGAIVGISWLPFILGPYFAIKLAKAEQGPSSTGRAIAFAVAGLAAFFLGAFVAYTPPINFGKMAAGYALMVVAAGLVVAGWKALGKTLVAYGFAARIPVVVIMYFAIRGNWGTHYDALPPDYPGPTDVLSKYVLVGVLPQLIFWIALTAVIGGLLGAIAAAVTRRRRPPISAA